MTTTNTRTPRDRIEDSWAKFEVTYMAASELHPHPESLGIFGAPEESTAYEEVKESVRTAGIQEPLVVLSDGRILSGCTRHQALMELRGASGQVPVRVHPGFRTVVSEVTYIIDANAKRRQMSPKEIAAAYRRLRDLPVKDGGEKRRPGRPKKSAVGASNKKGAAGGTISQKPRLKSGEAAAKRLGIGKHKAAALDTVFHTPGVPEEVLDSVNAGTLPPTVAAKAVKAVAKAQGGIIANGAEILDRLASRGASSSDKNAAIMAGIRLLDTVAALISAHPHIHQGTWGEMVHSLDLPKTKVERARHAQRMIEEGQAKLRLEGLVAEAERVGADLGLEAGLLHDYSVCPDRLAKACETLQRRISAATNACGQRGEQVEAC